MAAIILAHLPSPGFIRSVAFAVFILLGIACLCALHVPRRPTDRGGFY
jgi:hypothetical protein